jgi:hypothetical protein
VLLVCEFSQMGVTRPLEVLVRARYVITLGVSIDAVVVLFAAMANAAYAPRTSCGTIKGPHWTFLKGRESGSKYGVTAIGPYACATAKKWVAKLANDPTPNHRSSLVNNNVLHNGPKGYVCAAHSSKEGRAFAGACTKGPALNPTSGFSWSGTP